VVVQALGPVVVLEPPVPSSLPLGLCADFVPPEPQPTSSSATLMPSGGSAISKEKRREAAANRFIVPGATQATCQHHTTRNEPV